LPAPARDELREISVRLAIGGIEHELHPVGQRELAADHERQFRFLRREMCADRARDRAFVGDGKRRIALRARAFDQFLGCDAPRREREVGEASEARRRGSARREYTV
jgi:hypothetical protein